MIEKLLFGDAFALAQFLNAVVVFERLIVPFHGETPLIEVVLDKCGALVIGQNLAKVDMHHHLGIGRQQLPRFLGRRGRGDQHKKYNRTGQSAR